MKILVTASVSDDPGKFYTDYMTRLGAESVAATAAAPVAYSDEFAGLLLSGGMDVDPSLYGAPYAHPKTMAQPERDALELGLIKEFLSRGKPVFGICRGVQILSVYFGSELVQDIPDEVRGAIAHTSPTGFVEHEITACDSPIRGLFPASGVMRVNSSHHQAVKSVCGGLVVAARSPDGVIEAVAHKTRPAFGVQCHPERYEGADSFALEFLRMCAEAK